MQYQFLTIPLLLYLMIFFLVPLSSAQIIIPINYENLSDVTDFGAIGDGSHNDQQAVQNCIDEVSKQGGGIVHFPLGRWMTSQIYLKDNVILKFEEKCTIAGQIMVRDVKNVGIIGSEDEWVFIDAPIRFLNSKNILLKNIFTREDWWPRDCQGIRMENIKLEWPMERQANGDGITFVNCKDVFGRNLDITANDDVWCLKRTAINIHLTNSVLCSRQASSFKIGTESDGIFKNISVTNCIFYNSTRAGINIESVDGADIDNLYFSDIQMYNVAAPLFINLGYRNRYGKGKIGSIKNVTIANIKYVGMRNEELTGSLGSSIHGLPGHKLENITISNVHFVYKGGGTKADAHREIPEHETFYPEFDIFGRLPAYGLYVRHVKGLTLRDMTVGISNPDLRPALVVEDVEDLKVEGFAPQAYIGRSEYYDPLTNKPSQLGLHQQGTTHTWHNPPWDDFERPEPSIRLFQVRNAIITNCQTPMNTHFVELVGDQTDNIALISNNLTHSPFPPYKISSEVKGQISLSPLTTVTFNDLLISSFNANESIPVKVAVQNQGKKGYAKAELILDNQIVDRAWIWLEKNQSQTIELETPKLYEEKTYQISIDNLSESVKLIPASGQFEFSNLELPSIGATGESFSVKVCVKNIGSQEKSDQMILFVDEKELQSENVTLKPGEETVVNFHVNLNEAGTFQLAVAGLMKTISINPIWIDENKNDQIDSNDLNFSTFKEAIAKANEGEQILVKPGYYEINAEDLPIRVNKKNLIIKSVSGAEKTIIETKNANEMMRKQHSIFYVSAEGVQIKGFTMKGAWSNVCLDSVKGCVVSDNFFDFSKRHHVYLENAKNCVVKNNKSRAALYSFLGMTNCQECLIEDNYNHEDPCGMIVRNSQNNIFRRNHFDGLAWYGITFHSSDNNLIEDNLFEAGRINGLQFRTKSCKNKVIKNTFRNHIKEAILLDTESRDNLIHQNNIVGNKGLAVTNETPFLLDATQNWWGSPDGPSGAANGTGDSVDSNVKFKSWLKAPIKNSWTNTIPVVNHWH